MTTRAAALLVAQDLASQGQILFAAQLLQKYNYGWRAALVILLGKVAT